jgi:8-oxo-dGTP pyrophosphatase MutT (NUDIX family)
LEREIAEELALDVRVGTLLDSWVYAITPAVRVLIVTFGCAENAEREAKLSHEHKQLAWFPIAEIETLPMPEGYRASIRAWAAHLGMS